MVAEAEQYFAGQTHKKRTIHAEPTIQCLGDMQTHNNILESQIILCDRRYMVVHEGIKPGKYQLGSGHEQYLWLIVFFKDENTIFYLTYSERPCHPSTQKGTLIPFPLNLGIFVTCL